MTVTRGTSNTNVRGNTCDRQARRTYLVDTFPADVGASVLYREGIAIDVQPYNPRLDGCAYVQRPACRCYRCGRLLVVETVTVDRIVPGCAGGTYRRNNIRPACAACNSSTGGALAGRARKKAA